MINPWLKLSARKPYILGEDIEVVKKFNKKVNLEHRIFFNLLPEPYSGNPFTAKIILLQLNPGVDDIVGYEDSTENFMYKRFPFYKKDLLNNIRHKRNKYQFFNLNPEHRLLGGFRYWYVKFSPFIKSKEDYKRVANKVCVIEFFPYHSKQYKDLGSVLKCQEYNFKLVELAIKRNAVIILMRGKKQWLSSVPKLKGRYVSLRSNRNVILSKTNLGKDFERINNILSH